MKKTRRGKSVVFKTSPANEAVYRRIYYRADSTGLRWYERFLNVWKPFSMAYNTISGMKTYFEIDEFEDVVDRFNTVGQVRDFIKKEKAIARNRERAAKNMWKEIERKSFLS